MTEQTEQALAESVTEIIGWVEQAKDFAVEQAPLVVEELLHWKLVMGITGAVVFLVLAAGCGVLSWQFNKRHNEIVESGAYDTAYWDVGCVFVGIGAATFFFVSWVPALAAVKVLVAPRLVVLDALKNLL